MNKPSPIIGRLVDGGNLAVRPSRPFALFARWLCQTIVATSIIIIFMKPRPDLAQQLVMPLYLAEVACLFLIILSAAVSAIWLCYPDLRQKPKIVFLPLLPILIFTGLSIYRLFHPEITVIPPPEKTSGIDCALCVTVFAIAPGLFMFFLLRRHATIYPKIAGALSFMASASIGLLALKMIEPNDSVFHLLLWHVSPMIPLGLIGAWLGKKYLSW